MRLFVDEVLLFWAMNISSRFLTSPEFFPSSLEFSSSSSRLMILRMKYWPCNLFWADHLFGVQESPVVFGMCALSKVDLSFIGLRCGNWKVTRDHWRVVVVYGTRTDPSNVDWSGRIWTLFLRIVPENKSYRAFCIFADLPDICLDFDFLFGGNRDVPVPVCHLLNIN